MRFSQAALALLLGLLAASVVCFLLLPVLTILFNMGPDELLEKLNTPLAYKALKLSLISTLITLGLIITFGMPLAFFLANSRFPGKKVVEVLVIQLPIVIPPSVAGVGLLMMFGRFGWLGRWFDAAGISIAFTLAAVVMAQTFIAAPFFIQNARTAFAGIDPNLANVARTLGYSRLGTFFRVFLPLSLPGLVSGAALSWARALGEFGATLMFAGNLSGVTQTLPLAIYSAMESDLQVAIAISALLIAAAFVLLLTVKGLEAWPAIRRRRRNRRELKRVCSDAVLRKDSETLPSG